MTFPPRDAFSVATIMFVLIMIECYDAAEFNLPASYKKEDGGSWIFSWTITHPGHH